MRIKVTRKGKVRGIKTESRLQMTQGQNIQKILRDALEIGDGMLRAYVTTEGSKPDEHLTIACFFVF